MNKLPDELPIIVLGNNQPLDAIDVYFPAFIKIDTTEPLIYQQIKGRTKRD